MKISVEESDVEKVNNFLKTNNVIISYLNELEMIYTLLGHKVENYIYNIQFIIQCSFFVEEKIKFTVQFFLKGQFRDVVFLKFMINKECDFFVTRELNSIFLVSDSNCTKEECGIYKDFIKYAIRIEKLKINELNEVIKVIEKYCA